MHVGHVLGLHHEHQRLDLYPPHFARMPEKMPGYATMKAEIDKKIHKWPTGSIKAAGAVVIRPHPVTDNMSRDSSSHWKIWKGMASLAYRVEDSRSTRCGSVTLCFPTAST